MKMFTVFSVSDEDIQAQLSAVGVSELEAAKALLTTYAEGRGYRNHREEARQLVNDAQSLPELLLAIGEYIKSQEDFNQDGTFAKVVCGILAHHQMRYADADVATALGMAPHQYPKMQGIDASQPREFTFKPVVRATVNAAAVQGLAGNNRIKQQALAVLPLSEGADDVNVNTVLETLAKAIFEIHQHAFTLLPGRKALYADGPASAGTAGMAGRAGDSTESQVAAERVMSKGNAMADLYDAIVTLASAPQAAPQGQLQV